MKPIAITSGEPAGIGLDIVIQRAQRPTDVPVVVFCDPDVLQERAALLNLPLIVDEWDSTAAVGFQQQAQHLSVCSVKAPAKVVPGQLNVINSSYVMNCLEAAVTCCLDGTMRALVTGPVQKSIINEAGILFSGHTEYLAERCGVPRTCMLFVTSEYKIALQTTHIPLKQVSSAITSSALKATLVLLDAELRRLFSIAHPRILVCGLNPHAGEHGYLGHEEQDIIIPTLEECRSLGIDAIGPFSADTVFIPSHHQSADAILAMYHDQALPVIKHSQFESAVNVTLGLPIIRTSVDHGTALSLAGTGRASAVHLDAAIRCADRLTTTLNR